MTTTGTASRPARADGRDPKVIDRYAAEIVTGARFGYADASHTSADRMSYNPPLNSRAYGNAIAALGRYATAGNRAAATVAQVVGKINLYGTKPMALASIARALQTVVRDGYYDVVTATGPEPGRPSSHQHPATLRDAIMLELLYAEIEAALDGQHEASIGWCLHALVEENDITVHAAYLPRVARYLAK